MPDRTLSPADLPPELRLALAYAPGAVRADWLALFALDTRLAQIVRATREPVLAQMRLAWWRERLAGGSSTAPCGEPVLAVLAEWGGAEAGLCALADGWEHLLGEAPLGAGQIAGFAKGRGEAFAALAGRIGANSDAAAQAATGWALVNLAGRMSDPAERAAARQLAQAHDWNGPRMPRKMRPLSVLHGLARRADEDGALLRGPASLLAAIRLGLTGF